MPEKCEKKISDRRMMRRVPTFASAFSKTTSSNDESTTTVIQRRPRKQGSYQIESGKTKRIGKTSISPPGLTRGNLVEDKEKQLIADNYQTQTEKKGSLTHCKQFEVVPVVGEEQRRRTKNVNAIFNVVNYPSQSEKENEGNDSHQLPFGLESPVKSEKSEDSSSVTSSEPGARIHNLINELEKDLEKLHQDFNAKIKKEPDDLITGKQTSSDFKDLFERSPPDDNILKQYFPSMYKTTDEILAKPFRRPPLYQNSGELLEEVQNRMRILSDNLDWSKLTRHSNDMNGIYNSFQIDPNLLTAKLGVKKLVDDCITSLEPQVKEEVDKQLEIEKKRTVLKERSRPGISIDKTKKYQVSRLCRKQMTNPAGKTSRTLASTAKSPVRSRVEDYLKASGSTKNRILKASENFGVGQNGLNKENKREPFLWEENTHGHLYGNLLGLGRRVTEYRPYFHLQNSLPPDPMPWPPSTPQKSTKKQTKIPDRSIYSLRRIRVREQSMSINSSPVIKSSADKIKKSNVKSSLKKNSQPKFSKLPQKPQAKKTKIDSKPTRAIFLNLQRDKTLDEIEDEEKILGQTAYEKIRADEINSTNVVQGNPSSRKNVKRVEVVDANQTVGIYPNDDTNKNTLGDQSTEKESKPLEVATPVIISTKKQVRFRVNHRSMPILKRSDCSPERCEELTKNVENSSGLSPDDTLSGNRSESSFQELSEKANEKHEPSGRKSLLKKVDLSPDKFISNQKNLREFKQNSKWMYFEISNDDTQAAGDYFENEEFISHNEDNQEIIKRGGGGDAAQNLSSSTQENANYQDYQTSHFGEVNEDADVTLDRPSVNYQEGGSNENESNPSEEENELSQFEDGNLSANEATEMSSGDSAENYTEENNSLIPTEEIKSEEIPTEELSSEESESEQKSTENMVRKSESDRDTREDSVSGLSQIENADVIELPGFTPPPQQEDLKQKAPRVSVFSKKSKHRLPPSTDLFPQNQRSVQQLMRTAQDWIESELIARSLSHVRQSGVTNKVQHGPNQTLDSEDTTLIKNLVQEIVNEKAIELFRRFPKNDERIKRAENDEETVADREGDTNTSAYISSIKRIETPLPTPPSSPVPSYSDAFEDDDEDLERVSTPLSSISDDSKRERLSGGGKYFNMADPTDPPFTAYAERVDTPNPTPPATDTNVTPLELPERPDVETPQTPSLSESSSPSPAPDRSAIALHRVPEEPTLVTDQVTQTSFREEVMSIEELDEVQISEPVETLYPQSAIKGQGPHVPPNAQISTAEKATSAPTPSDSDPNSTASSFVISSISEGEWLHLKPWQTITPFVRYTHQASTLNASSIGSLDNTLNDMDDLEQDPISEGEIRIPNVSAWRTSLLAAAIASGIHPQAMFGYSGESLIETSIPGPSTRPSALFSSPSNCSLGEVVVGQPNPGVAFDQVSGVFTASLTSVQNPTQVSTTADNPSLVQGNVVAENTTDGNHPHRITVQHIRLADSSSSPSDNAALQHAFLPAEPGLVLPDSQSLDPANRRQFLERLVSEGEIRSSYLLSPNRVSDPDHIRNWGRSHVMIMTKRTTSAPGLHSSMRYPMDNGKRSIATQLISAPTSRELSKVITTIQQDDSDESSTSFMEEIHPTDTDIAPTCKIAEPLTLAKKQSECVTPHRQTAMESAPIATTSRAAGVTFREFPLEMQEGYPSSIPKTKFRKSALKKSLSKCKQDANFEGISSPTNNVAGSSSTSSSGIPRPSPSGETFQRRSHHMMVRSSPGMLPEDFQGQMTLLHPVASKSAILDLRQDSFKESSGLIIGSLGTIDEESSEVLPGPPKRRIHSSDSDGDYPEENNITPVRLSYDKNKKTIDRSLSHSADLSEGEVPARETRSHQ